MPDIDMCNNKTCDIKSRCYRSVAKPSLGQYYNTFNSNEKPGSPCHFFVEHVEHKKRFKIEG